MPIPKQTFSVLNTSGHIISGPGVALQPGLNEGISVAAFTKAFLGADGQPTLSAAKHLIPSGDKPPSVLPITVKAVPALPQDFALLAIAGAQPEDRRTLHALLEVETRKPVAEAIRAKLAAMDRAAEPPAVAISQPGPRIHFGDKTIARGSGHAFAAGVKASIEPRATPEEARAMLIPISHEPESSAPAGITVSGSPEHAPEVTSLPGNISASPVSATMASGQEAPTAPLASSAEPATSTGPARRARRGQG